ncbi:O-antigen ligase family protein [Parvibium lacunae]|uniref:O-antigen ligase domain-containing protein n=1 Tax=Parvibium lacunae TaxID=1888893 RepID=A0A368KZ69_9BURK|nr:O-antigen ligase family protein [Parvibium lacunae]RCS56670.1 O-antigen ligase domain-containing protein [Parvibium lacunae]
MASVSAPPRAPLVPPHTDAFTERWGKILIIAFAMLAILPRALEVDPKTADFSAGSVNGQIQLGGILLLGFVLFFKRFERTFYDLRQVNVALLLLVIWAFASALWSPSPVTTIKRTIQAGGVIFMGLSMCLVQHPLQNFLKYVTNTLSLLLILSLILIVVAPDIAREDNTSGHWRGVFEQKNGLGAVAAFCFIFWQARYYIEGIPLRRMLAGLGLSTFCLLLAHSSTSISVSLLASGVFHLFRARHLSSSFWKLRVFLLLTTVISVVLVLFFSVESRLPNWSEVVGPLASIFGKGTDLSQRTVIWQLVGEEVKRHPIMGLGYGAFWMGPGSPSQYIIDELYWIPYQSHNGYLDTINELGYIGLAILIAALLLHLSHIVRLFAINQVVAAFHLAIFIVLAISNYTESNLFRGMLINSSLFIYSSVCVTNMLFRGHGLIKMHAGRGINVLAAAATLPLPRSAQSRQGVLGRRS